MFLRKIATMLVVISPLAFFACAEAPYGCFGGWDHMRGYGFAGGIMWLILLLLLAVLIYFLVQASKSKGSEGSIVETPLDILKKRYAKGEIDKDEFEKMKKDLES